jgi:DNA-binding CsgD family transcriptional regulator
VIEALHRHGDRAATLAEIEKRRGRQLAPEACDAALAAGDALWAALDSQTPHEDVLAVPRIAAPRGVLGEIALAFGRFADLKMPFAVGHSTAVATLAVDAGRHAGLPEPEVERLRLAALLHDLGAVSVGNQVWDRAGPLGVTGWEQVRLHAYHTERILALSPATRPLAALAGAHHERLDGSGYPRGGRELGRPERILAAADEYAALVEARPYRAALPPDDAAKALAADAAAGKLCREAVACVLAAAGQPVAAAKRSLPAGLTEREAEVLGLVARGLVSKEIAVALDIATRTVKHHIEHVYAKTGVSTRAAAALFAARHDLVATRPNDP